MDFKSKLILAAERRKILSKGAYHPEIVHYYHEIPIPVLLSRFRKRFGTLPDDEHTIRNQHPFYHRAVIGQVASIPDHLLNT